MKEPNKSCIFFDKNNNSVLVCMVAGLLFMFTNIFYPQANRLGQGLNVLTCDICCSIKNVDETSPKY